MKINALHAAAGLSVIAAAACGDPTGGGPPPPPENPAITASVLTSGGEGVLQGTHLDKLSGGITVDGVSVTPTARTATEIRFPMPLGRACEVDGRPVAVQAGRACRSTRGRYRGHAADRGEPGAHA